MPVRLNLKHPIKSQPMTMEFTMMPAPPSKDELEEKYTGGKIVAPTINGKTLDEILDKVDLKKKRTVPKNNIKFIF